MDIKRFKKHQVVNWQYLPGAATIFKYLKLTDLKKLSMSCKRYRNQLERTILKNLYLDRYSYYQSYGRNCTQLEIVNIETFLDIMEKALKGKYQLVKGISIRYYFENDRFAKKVIDLFPHIKKLKIRYDNYDNVDGMDILTIFKGMKHVENAEFINHGDDLDSFYTFNEQIFSKSLKSLIFDIELYEQNILTVFDTIDSSYVNLRKITIATDKMLANLSSNMPNLTDAKLCCSSNLDDNLILEFLKKNPQLKGLELDPCDYNYDLFNTILSSSCLSILFFRDIIIYELEIDRDLRLNYSIKKLKIEGVHCSIISKLIKSCQNLESVEFNRFHFTEEDESIWDNFNRRIDTLKFNLCNCLCDPDFASYIQTIDKLKLFNQVIFVSHKSYDNIVEQLNLDKLRNYKLHPNIAEDEGYETIVHTVNRIKKY